MRPNSSRGATETQPAGRPSMYASRPGSRPRETSDRSPRLVPAPLCRWNSAEVSRNHMHQQLEYAPLGPNSRSR
jgi:hypothetical protein